MKKIHIYNLVELLFGLTIIFLYSLQKAFYVNFIPINGSFQNYNPIRRLLSGQIPCKDFYDYLGLGHLSVGSVVTYIFGGNFKSSLIAFSFLTILSFYMLIFLSNKIFFKKISYALAVTNIYLIFIMYNCDKIVYKTKMIKFVSGLNVGNSARFVRGMILPITCFLLAFVWKYIESYKNIYLCNLIVGSISGISIIWSNDYGLSCWFCITLINIFYCIYQKRNIICLIGCFFEIIVSFFTAFLIVEIFTFGNFINWFKYNFGNGQYQSWYYLSYKTYYLWELDYNFLTLMQVLLCLYYFIKFIRKDNEKKSLFFLYINMVSVCAIQEYHLISGGNNREIALNVLVLTAFIELFDIINKNINFKKDFFKKFIASFSVFLSIIYLANMSYDIYKKNLEKKDGVYVKKLGGYNTEYGEDLIKTNEFLNGNSFFSVYSSAQEVVSNQYQPTGIDYIIHVMGDEWRNNYVKELRESNTKYVSLINKEISGYVFWEERADWYFYREIYKNYYPVYKNNYCCYWEKSNNIKNNLYNGNYELKLTKIDDGMFEIKLLCDKKINGIADVYIDYKVVKEDSFKALANFHRFLKVDGIDADGNIQGYGYDMNYLREKSKEYIPVRVYNGYGRVLLTSEPEKHTELLINNYKCYNIFMVSPDYIEVDNNEVSE